MHTFTSDGSNSSEGLQKLGPIVPLAVGLEEGGGGGGGGEGRREREGGRNHTHSDMKGFFK